MRTGQKSRHACLLEGDGYRLEAMLVDDSAKRSSKCCGLRPFAETDFVGDFPGRHRADAGDGLLGRHDPAGPIREPSVSGKKPNESMAIEEHPHRRPPIASTRLPAGGQKRTHPEY